MLFWAVLSRDYLDCYPIWFLTWNIGIWCICENAFGLGWQSTEKMLISNLNSSCLDSTKRSRAGITERGRKHTHLSWKIVFCLSPKLCCRLHLKTAHFFLPILPLLRFMAPWMLQSWKQCLIFTSPGHCLEDQTTQRVLQDGGNKQTKWNRFTMEPETIIEC